MCETSIHSFATLPAQSPLSISALPGSLHLTSIGPASQTDHPSLRIRQLEPPQRVFWNLRVCPPARFGRCPPVAGSCKFRGKFWLRRWFVLQSFGVYYDDYMRSVEAPDSD